MTADAVALQDFRTVTGEGYPLGNHSRVEVDKVLHAVDGFPDVMGSGVVVGEVAFDAANPPVGAGVAPCGVLFLHDVATGAEGWRL